MKRLFGKWVLTFSVCLMGMVGSAQSIAVKTSDNLRDLSQKWADAYTAKHTQTKIRVSVGVTPDVFVALAGRKTDLATVARKIRYKETQACEAAFGQRPTEFKVGVIGAVAYVHADNPVSVLMYEELEDIFLGKRRNWKQVGGKESPMTVYGIATNTLAGELFSLEVLTGKAVTNDVRLVSQVELLNAIARDPNAIGFGDFNSAPGIRALKIKRVFSSTPVEPNADVIANRIYPISQFVYAYLNPEVNQGEIKSYLDWIRSDEGQQVSAQVGCFAVPAKWRTP